LINSKVKIQNSKGEYSFLNFEFLLLPMISRRHFIGLSLILGVPVKFNQSAIVMTVAGEMNASAMGLTLIHEHFLVDFIGADKTDPSRWDREEVVKRVLPFLLEAKKNGVKTILDCTPAYLGRDPLLLQRLQDSSGLNILTNTGFYGAVQNKYLPPIAMATSPEELSDIWMKEIVNGIDKTGVQPGFIKISVDSNEGNGLSSIHKKLVRAAALTHLKSGLTICSHTGIAKTAFEEIEIIQKVGAAPSSFVWVHAQAEKDRTQHVKAAQMGTWVSLDGMGWGDFDEYAEAISNLKAAGLLHRVLISHDAGWYHPGEANGGEFKGYTNIFTEILPRLKKIGFVQNDFDQLLIRNPAEAFTIRIRMA